MHTLLYLADLMVRSAKKLASRRSAAHYHAGVVVKERPCGWLLCWSVWVVVDIYMCSGFAGGALLLGCRGAKQCEQAVYQAVQRHVAHLCHVESSACHSRCDAHCCRCG